MTTTTSLKPRRYRSELTGETFDVIVIGSGLGGLTTAALLAKAGKRVLILERHYVPGGFTQTFKRKGFEWDVGVHYVGDLDRENSMGRKIFDHITGGRLQWASMGETYDVALIEGDRYEFVAGREKQIDRLIGYFPEEREAIQRYFELLDTVRGATQMYFGERAMPPFLSRSVGWFLRRRFNRLSDMTTHEALSRITSNPKLIGVLCAQCGDYGLAPRRSSFAAHAMVAGHYVNGGSYPSGGAKSIYEGILAVIEENGGRIALNAEVERVLLDRGKAIGVRLANGDELRAGTVVSAAGARITYQQLLPSDLPGREQIDTDLARVAPSNAHLCLYLGLDRSDEALELPKYNYWIYDDYDFDRLLDRYADEPEADPPFAYVSFPSAKDPEWAANHPGKAAVQVLGMAPYRWFEGWEDQGWQRRGEGYDAFKQRLHDRLMRVFVKVAPQCEGHVETSELSTPLSTRHFTNNARGEIYGLEHTPDRFRLKWLRPHTPVKNLFMTGQDVVTVGVTGAAASGVLTASTILKRNLMSRLQKG